MASTVVLRETISRNIFGSNYLRNEKYLMQFFLHFPNLDPILNIYKKKIILVIGSQWVKKQS